MQQNVGEIDRAVRLVAGTVLVVLGLAVLGGLLSVVPSQDLLMGLAAALVGIVFLTTGLARTCPLNALFGLDTRGGGATGSGGPGRSSNGNHGS